MKYCREDLLVNIFKCIESFFDIYCQSKDMADFRIYKASWKFRPQIDIEKRGQLLKAPE